MHPYAENPGVKPPHHTHHITPSPVSHGPAPTSLHPSLQASLLDFGGTPRDKGTVFFRWCEAISKVGLNTFIMPSPNATVIARTGRDGAGPYSSGYFRGARRWVCPCTAQNQGWVCPRTTQNHFGAQKKRRQQGREEDDTSLNS